MFLPKLLVELQILQNVNPGRSVKVSNMLKYLFGKSSQVFILLLHYWDVWNSFLWDNGKVST